MPATRLRPAAAAVILGIALAACGESAASTSTSPSAAVSSGATATSAATAAGFDATAYFGNWTGTWKNTTFGSQGTVTLIVNPDTANKKVTVTVTLTGNVLGGTAPPPLTFAGTYGANGATLTPGSAIFGRCTASLSPSGQITAECSDVPSARVSGFTVSGSWPTSGDSALTYTVTFRDGTPKASGTVTFSRH